MRLREYLRNDLVLPGLDASDAAEALGRLAEAMADRGVVREAAPLRGLLLAREAAHTTSLGNGVAVPHATLEGVDGSVIGIGIAPEGVPFGAPPERVDVVFLLLSPRDQSSMHIKLLARIARLVRHPDFVERLRRARSAQDVLDEIERVDAEHV